jgi:deazaflavin-dependent oxidoreductase (nitroreductase family)
MSDIALKQTFKFLNKFFMVPLFRLGLGPLMVSPLSGYIMVIKTVGRKSGKVRFAPVNYAIEDGCVYCLAGFGGGSDWFRNLKSRPQVEVMLPGRSFAGVTAEVTDHAERVRVARQILINAGFAGFFEGYNPRKKTPEEVEQLLGGRPIVRIQPVGLGSGPHDYSGWGWIPLLLFGIALTAALIAALT